MNKQERLAWLPELVLYDMALASDPTRPWFFPDSLGGREKVVRIYQAFAGLKVDGWPGQKTAQALYGSGLPIARDRDHLHDQVGSYEWERAGEGRRIRIKGHWARKNVVTLQLHTGQRARIHRIFADEFKAGYRVACLASGYTPTSVQTFNPRVIGGTEKLSMHALAVASDFDPPKNRWGGKQDDGSMSMMRRHPMFYEVWEWLGWRWGGRWDKGKGDDMHVQRKR